MSPYITYLSMRLLYLKRFLDKNSNFAENEINTIIKERKENPKKYINEHPDDYEDRIYAARIYEELSIKAVLYELNSIREYFLFSTINIYYGQREQLDIVNKYKRFIDIISINNFNYDDPEVDSARKNYIIKFKPKAISELLLLYGSVDKIPNNYKKQIDKMNSLKMDSGKYLENFYDEFDIKNNPHWSNLEKLRKIVNAFKHRDGFKNFTEDDAKILGEKYEATIDEVYNMIESVSLFFYHLWKKTNTI